MIAYQKESGTPLVLGNRIGGGGEGEIYEVAREPRLAAKIYKNPTSEHREKLGAMIAQPPYGVAHGQHTPPLAWPLERIYSGNRCVGFIMPRIANTTSLPLLKFYNPKSRLKTFPTFSWKYLLHAATNLASVMSALHQNNYFVGDMNEGNILVSKSALITLVDCDSIQVPRQGGGYYRCVVGKPEYTPHELQGRDFRSIDRKEYHDNFGLAVLIFQMLMEGVHPFSGVWQGAGNPPTLEQHIQAGNCPYLPKSTLRPPPGALPLQTLPHALQSLVLCCFDEGHRSPSRRPKAYDWYQALQQSEQQIVSCHQNSQHWYSQHLSLCPWCERIRQNIPDSFPPSPPKATISLPYSGYQSAPPYAAGYAPQHIQYPGHQQQGFAGSPYTTGYGQQQMQYLGHQQQGFTGLLQSMHSSRSFYRQLTSGKNPFFLEVLFSFLGIFGVGRLIAGKKLLGIVLITGSIFIYLPYILPFLQQGKGIGILIVIVAIIFNAVEWHKEMSRRP